MPGLLLDATPEPGGGTVRFTRSVLRLRVSVGGAVFVGWDGACPGPSQALPDGPPAVDERVALEPDTGGGWRLVSERVLVTVTRRGAVEVRTPGGLLLRRDLAPRWWESDGGAAHWEQRAEVAADAGFFGLGEQARGPALPDGTHRLGGGAVAGPGLAPGPVPVQLVVAGVGTHLVFHDNSWSGRVVLRRGWEGAGSGHDRPGRSVLRMDGGPVRYWVLPGPPARALREWAALTGAAPPE